MIVTNWVAAYQKYIGPIPGVGDKTAAPEKTVPVKPVSGGSFKPDAAGNCPKSAPIKGNASSHIYHVPGGSLYEKTKAETCFATEAAAQAAGFRRSKR